MNHQSKWSLFFLLGFLLSQTAVSACFSSVDQGDPTHPCCANSETGTSSNHSPKKSNSESLCSLFSPKLAESFEGSLEDYRPIEIPYPIVMIWEEPSLFEASSFQLPGLEVPLPTDLRLHLRLTKLLI